MLRSAKINSLTLKHHNSFRNWNKRKTRYNFATRPLIFKLQEEVLEFDDICVSCSSPKTELETNFLNLENKRFEIASLSRSFIKRETSDTSSDNEWQRVTTSGTISDNEWYNGWQRMTMSGYFGLYFFLEEPCNRYPKPWGRHWREPKIARFGGI